MDLGKHLLGVAQRARSLRRAQRVSQEEMARRASMSLRSYQAFEAKGNIPLRKLANVLVVLSCEADLDRLIRPTSTFRTLDEFEKASVSSTGVTT